MLSFIDRLLKALPRITRISLNSILNLCNSCNPWQGFWFRLFVLPKGILQVSETPRYLRQHGGCYSCRIADRLVAHKIELDMGQPLPYRLLRPLAQVRENEAVTALLMFSYSFLSMTAYNILKPVTRSKFISDIGATNLPYVQLTAGVIIGLIMTGYSWMVSRLPRRWSLAITQGGIAALLIAFRLLFRTSQDWVSAAFYLFGLMLGILLISQFWTLANVVYDPRQAKRLFGFVGAGAPLGGIAGSLFLMRYAKWIGAVDLLLYSAALMLICMVLVAAITLREPLDAQALLRAVDEKGVGGRRALQLLRKSDHLQSIALVIGFAAIGAVIIEQQLNMAIESSKGAQATDAITAFLAGVQLWTSVIGFVIQLTLTSRIHRRLGIGFALVLLPLSLGATGIVVLVNAALWVPSLARVFDQSLRYTIDKTTREILYLPLPADIKYEAKAFVDVTVDRLARGAAAVLLLVLIQPWGLGLGWRNLSYASIIVTGLWLVMALRARKGYQDTFRRSIEAREMQPAEVGLAIADLSTIETLIREMASPDERKVLYAIDILESLDKRNLITPLLLFHEAPAVRVRALTLLSDTAPQASARWLPAIRSMMADESAEVRAAAVGALAGMRDQKATDLVRPHLGDDDPRIAMTAAMVLAGSGREEDAEAAERVLTRIASDASETAAPLRRDFAVAIRHVPYLRFQRLLIPLLNDTDVEVAEEAMRSIRKIGAMDFIFVPKLVSLLHHRRHRSSARELLVGYGEPVLDILCHFLRDPEEDIWVRRHIPAAIARIPCQKAMDILIDALEEPDGYLRFNIIAALERLHRLELQLAFRREPIEELVLQQGERYFECASLQRILLEHERAPQVSLLSRAVAERLERTVDRVYRILGLIYPWKDVAAARYAIEHGDDRARAGALEFLDSILSVPLRKHLMPLLEETPLRADRADPGGRLADKPLSSDAALLRLIEDDDPALSASAILLVGQQKRRSLQGDLERVLATRPAQDWYVFEAASWVSAAFRMPDAKRRALWREPLPAAEVADQLRRLPLFASVPVNELFRIAGAGRQVRCEPGRLLYREAEVPDSVNFLLDGAVAVGKRTGDAGELRAPAALGFREVFSGAPMRASIRAIDAAVCLSLSSEECRALLSDEFDLLEGIFRMLCQGGVSGDGRLILKGNPAGSGPPSNGDLKLIEKVLILKSIPAFTGVTAEEMVYLAAVTAEVPLKISCPVFAASEDPALFAMVSGEVSLEASGTAPALKAGPADVIGVYQTLAGIPFDRTARVMREGSALRINREDLFDLFSQRPDLLQQILSALLRTQSEGKADVEIRAEPAGGPS